MENNKQAGSGNTEQYKIQIVHLAGENKGQVEKFTTDVISFGRSPECSVIFRRASLTVSRVHAIIVQKNNQFYLENNSGNGCYVNNRRTDQALLESGDVISFSESGPKVRFIFNKISHLETPVQPMRGPINKHNYQAMHDHGHNVELTPRSNDEMRTYIVPMPKPSIFNNIKSAMSKKKSSTE